MESMESSVMSHKTDDQMGPIWQSQRHSWVSQLNDLFCSLWQRAHGFCAASITRHSDTRHIIPYRPYISRPSTWRANEGTRIPSVITGWCFAWPWECRECDKSHGHMMTFMIFIHGRRKLIGIIGSCSWLAWLTLLSLQPYHTVVLLMQHVLACTACIISSTLHADIQIHDTDTCTTDNFMINLHSMLACTYLIIYVNFALLHFQYSPLLQGTGLGTWTGD